MDIFWNYAIIIVVTDSKQSGLVGVKVTAHGECLGTTCFRYFDEIQQLKRLIIHDPAVQSLSLPTHAKEDGVFGTDSDNAQVLDSQNLKFQGKGF